MMLKCSHRARLRSNKNAPRHTPAISYSGYCSPNSHYGSNGQDELSRHLNAPIVFQKTRNCKSSWVFVKTQPWEHPQNPAQPQPASARAARAARAAPAAPAARAHFSHPAVLAGLRASRLLRGRHADDSPHRHASGPGVHSKTSAMATGNSAAEHHQCSHPQAFPGRPNTSSEFA